MQATVQPGDVLLGKYRVERVLGQGGMGVVVAVRHIHLGELFAIKMLLPSALSHGDAVERFLREARATARLKGEHVARVHDVGSLENGAPYMVMEYLDGSDLKQIVKSRGGLPLDEAVLYTCQACEAVTEAHAIGIVHRDLKPANLFLIRRPNGAPCVKVLDFGISKELDAGNSAGFDLTKTGAFMGSPNYMSPEQMANIKATDMRSDIWALGVILYEFVVGKVPFTAAAVTELVTKVLTTSPTPPSQLRPDIPAAFDAIVLRCLEKRPEQRFQSVQQLMAELLPYARSNALPIPVVTGSPMAPPPSGRPSFPSTIVMSAMPPLGANQSISQSNSVQAPNLSEPFTAPSQSVITAGAWGNTSKTAERKDKKVRILLGAGLGLAALIGVALIATSSSTQEPASSMEEAKSVVPAATPETTASPIEQPPKESISVVPAPSEATSAVAPTAADTTPAAKAQNQPQTTKPSAPSKPANTAVKKSSIADFND